MSTTQKLQLIAAQATRLVEALADGDAPLAVAIAEQLDHDLNRLLNELKLGNLR